MLSMRSSKHMVVITVEGEIKHFENSCCPYGTCSWPGLVKSTQASVSELSETSNFVNHRNKRLSVKCFFLSWNNIAGLLHVCKVQNDLSLSLFLSQWVLWFVLCLLTQSCSSGHPKSPLHSFCHSPLPPVFSLYAHRRQSPFNPSSQALRFPSINCEC